MDLKPPLTPTQLTAAALIAGGLSQSQCAREIGVDKSTVTRWMRIDEFEAIVKSERRQFIERATRKLAACAEDAVLTLRSIVVDPLSSDRDKIAAAKEILDRGGLPATVRLQPQAPEPAESPQDLPWERLSDEEIEALRAAEEIRARYGL